AVEIVPGGIEQWFTGPGQPSAEFPFLHSDDHLGVPQKNLYRLYLSALSDMKTAESSAVILLANPAHQTALNARKRLILAGTLSLQAEIDFSGRLLASSNAASKEAIVWAHRRWIFGQLYPRRSFPEIAPAAVEAEFELISRCCEACPRNYHAWSHHHFIVECIHVSLRESHPTDTPYLALFVGELVKLRRWVESHVSDYSAMHQLCTMIARLLSDDLPGYSSTFGEWGGAGTHFEHALSLVIAYPSHESLWAYLRAVVRLAPSLAASAISFTAPLDGPLRNRLVLWIDDCIT
ncbi:hypothetical protein B0H15DRAFT_790135, partial [Mycena belliarum]